MGYREAKAWRMASKRESGNTRLLGIIGIIFGGIVILIGLSSEFWKGLIILGGIWAFFSLMALLTGLGDR